MKRLDNSLAMTSSCGVPGHPIVPPPPVPDVITHLVVAPGDGSAVAAWNEPESNGSTIVDYRLQIDDGSGFVDVVKGVSTTTQWTITGLTNGTAHQLRVATESAQGVSAFSSVVTFVPTESEYTSATHVFATAGQSNAVGRAQQDSGPFYPSGLQQYRAPSGPLKAATVPLDHVGEQAGDFSFDVAFAEAYAAAHPNVSIVLLPAAQGGTGFASGHWRPGDDRFTNLVNGLNSLFTDYPSFVFKGFLFALGEKDASLANTAFASDIDGLISALRSQVTVAGSTTPFVFTGINPNHTDHPPILAVLQDTPNRNQNVAYADVTGAVYPDGLHADAASVRLIGVRAFNALLAAEAPATQSVPDAITDLSATAGDGEVDLLWTAPADKGSPITAYRLQQRVSGGSFSDIVTLGSVTSYNDSTVTNGSTYEYRIFAENAMGEGGASNVVSAAPAAASSVTPFSQALRHWVFGTDNPTHQDLVASSVPTQNSGAVAPVSHDGYITLASGGAYGLVSDMPSARGRTVVAAVRPESLSSDNRMAINNYGPGNTGHGIWLKGDEAAWRINPQGKAIMADPFTSDASQFFFIAFVLRTDNSHTGYILSGGLQSETRSTGASLNATNEAVGNVHYGASNFVESIDVAEWAIIDAELPTSTLMNIASEMATRLSAKGLTLAS